MILDLKQAAERLGWHPRTLLRKMKEDPTLPAAKMGRGYRFIEEDLADWHAKAFGDEAEALMKCAQRWAMTVERHGVYVLFDRGKVIYIGVTKNFFRRCTQHMQDKKFNRVAFLPSGTEEDARRVERLLISHFKPPLNEHHLT